MAHEGRRRLGTVASLRGDVAQLVERCSCKAEVRGSTPRFSTGAPGDLLRRQLSTGREPHLAGIGEPGRPRHSVKVKIAGSNPVAGALGMSVRALPLIVWQAR